MSVQATNLHLMHSWELAYAFAGEAVLPLFGLSGSDIDAVLTVDLATRSRWAATSPAFALPRPGLLTALRAKDAPTAAHSLRVALGCSSWAQAAKLADDGCDELEVAALLHDIGKIGIADRVLLKPSKLAPEELESVERHRQMGVEILASCQAPQGVLEIVRYCSAWYDGRKPGFELQGDRLPLGARMVAIVDAERSRLAG